MDVYAGDAIPSYNVPYISIKTATRRFGKRKVNEMRCTSCGAQVTEKMQRCPECGRPIHVTQSGSMGKKIAIVSVILVLLVGSAIAYLLMHRPASITDINAMPATPSNLAIKDMRVTPPANPMSVTANVTPPANPTSVTATAPPQDVLDFIAFIQRMEMKRVGLEKSQIGQVIGLGAELTKNMLESQMSTNGSTRMEQQATQQFQQSLNGWAIQWQQLSAYYTGYNEPVPQSCVPLRDTYYALLGKTSSEMASISASFAQGVNGDPSKALQALQQMKGSSSQLGSASQQVNQGCQAADAALGALCDEYKIRKTFSITDDSSGGNPLNMML